MPPNHSKYDIFFRNGQVFREVSCNLFNSIFPNNDFFLNANSNYFDIFAENKVIMPQSAITIRLDSDLKKQFDSLCEEFGISTNTALNIYVQHVVMERKIPFTIEAPAKDDAIAKGREAFYKMRQAAAEAGIQDMPLDEIL